MRKRGAVSDKEWVAEIVMRTAKESKNLSELEQNLKAHQIDCYTQRDIPKGIYYGKRKLRFTTLGVGRQHLKTLTKEERRLRNLQKQKTRNHGKNKGR